ncbi:oleate hydratase [Aspergillus lucknowensis]|uniref:Oleate hydratase n=1 Tax=Aspergillus lucknowensis TaxID=176173 RepID=A0ABR4LHW3_9EURO
MSFFTAQKEQFLKNRHPHTAEAWILGTGTAALASALYLVRRANIPPRKVHVFDPHGSLGQALHSKGNASNGYDQFAGCLPVPVGEPLEELLALVPSVSDGNRSVFDEIKNDEFSRVADRAKEAHTQFLVQRNGVLRCIPTNCLNLGMRLRLALVRLMLKRESSLQRKQIRDYLPPRFFESSFWAIWSAQFGFQPWHSASEFRRTIRQYLHDFRGLKILSCLDITGHYQFEATFLPIYHFLRSLDVDFRFDAKVKDVVTDFLDAGERVVKRIDLVQSGFEVSQPVGKDDVVIATLGSTVSGSTTGTNEQAPFRTSMHADEALDENWSLWLELGAKHDGCFGDPYNFCTYMCESMLESFTITTEDLALWERLCSISFCPPDAGAFIALQESPWRLNLCLPTQPVFSEQPASTRVFWGFANFPQSRGHYVKKPMIQCSGAEITTELLRQLNLDAQNLVQQTVTVPRVMPRMSAILLARAASDRPRIIPSSISNIGLVGQFCDMRQHSCVDMSYGVRTAQKAVSHFTGMDIEKECSEWCNVRLFTVMKILCWR